MPSIGTIRRSRGTLTWIVRSAKRFLIRPTASPTISSTASGARSKLTNPSLILVTESKFSTIRMSQPESSLIPLIKLCSVSLSSSVSFSSKAELAPTMPVSGVLKSCEIARSKLLLIFSFADSMTIWRCSSDKYWRSKASAT
ncbi:hypothetical protein AF960_03123 [Listeria monocytogenes]|nr:hypothetical protein AF960_03123 [Listeria monocytogenes]